MLTPMFPSSDPQVFNPANPLANSILLSLLFPVAIPALLRYETPVQSRLALQTSLPFAMTAAAYHPTALDPFGAGAERRRCNAKEEYSKADKNFQDRQVALAYTTAWAIAAAFPSADIEMLKTIFKGWGLDYDICVTQPQSCSDGSTPWGLARSVVDATSAFFRYDGWNADGSLSRKFNKVPYQDWLPKPYTPRNTPFKLTNKRAWQPETENNGIGSIINPQHITPHIGLTGRPFHLTDDEVCDAKLKYPKYCLDDEIAEVLSRTATLDDMKKMQAEFFDNKFSSLIPLLVQYTAAKGINAVRCSVIHIGIAQRTAQIVHSLTTSHPFAALTTCALRTPSTSSGSTWPSTPPSTTPPCSRGRRRCGTS
jgi:hypothetical protein